MSAAQLLPALVVAGAAGMAHPALTQGVARAVNGTWITSVEEGAPVITHDPRTPPAAGYPMALFPEPVRMGDGTARIAFKLVDGGDDHTAGLVFGFDRARPTYYYARYNTKDGNVAIWRMDGFERTVLAHGHEHAQLPKHTWHELVLTVEGRQVRAVVNGRLSVEHELDVRPEGELGVWTKPDATSAFRVARVTGR